jgi:Tol biopolymer transport system component
MTPSPRLSPLPQPTRDEAGVITVGSLVQAIADELRVRRSPGVTGEVLGVLGAGQRATVTGGPRVADGLDWYEIALAPSNQVGWVAAGDPEDRWLAIVENSDLTLAWGFSVTRLQMNSGSRESLIELEADWQAGHLSWSPDGGRLAVVESKVDATLGCVLEARVLILDDAGRVMASTSPPEGWYDTAPNWSPDGALIAFTRASSTCTSTRDNRDLFVMPRDGGSERLVIGDVMAPTWSSAGDAFAFLRFDAAPTGIPGDLRGPEIWTVRADGNDPRRLGGREDVPGERERLSDSVKWAPHARLLAFSRAVGPELEHVEIAVMDEVGGVRPIAVVSEGVVRDLTWLPDGSGLAYIEERHLATAVVVLSLEGREIARYDLTDGVPDELIIAPDGTALAWKIMGAPRISIQPLHGPGHLIESVEATHVTWRGVLRSF